MISFINYLNMPSKVAIIIVAIFFFVQIVGELLEFKGKVVPEFVKIRKFFLRRRKERNETMQTLKEVRILLNDANDYYSKETIEKRNNWMNWVNSRAVVYDNSIEKLNNTIVGITEALNENTKMTEEIFIQSSRDRIIDFANRVSDEQAMASREEFNRIFKVYDEYEEFLEQHNRTNGEINIAYRIIKEAYEKRMRNHSFVEDIRGYVG